jgi:hypothetical protein
MVGSRLGLASIPEKKTQVRVTQQTDRTEHRSPQEIYSITYAMPGQVGFCVPRISTDEKYQERLVKLLKAEALVRKVQINITVASIVVIYTSGVLSDYEMRSHLVNLIQSGIAEPATIQLASSYPTISLTEHKFLLSRKLPKQGKSKQECSEIQNSENRSSCLSAQAQILPVSSSRPEFTVPPQKTEQQAKQSAKVAYSIAHVIPGRIRFHVPRIARDPKYVQRLEALLKADPTVIGERINRAAGSVVITYKSAVKANTKDRDSSVLETAISHLANLLQCASDVAVA